jgi:hypothetical protein
VNAGYYGGAPNEKPEGVIDIAQLTLTAMMAQTLLRDLDNADANPQVNLHHIHLPLFRNVGFRDFSKTDAMIQAGYEATLAYLAAPSPHLVAPPSAALQPPPALGATAPGAREVIPPYLPGR